MSRSCRAFAVVNRVHADHCQPGCRGVVATKANEPGAVLALSTSVAEEKQPASARRLVQLGWYAVDLDPFFSHSELYASDERLTLADEDRAASETILKRLGLFLGARLSPVASDRPSMAPRRQY